MKSSTEKLNTSHADASVTMLYDGGCPLCSKEVAHYKRRDKQSRVSWIDINADSQPLTHYSISQEAAMKRLHVIQDGQIVVGARAFAAVWSQLPGYRLIVPIVKLTPIMWLLDNVYNWFAEKRYASRISCKQSTHSLD